MSTVENMENNLTITPPAGKISVGIIGGAGYTGGELLRILVNHPHVDIAFVHSNSNAGNYIYEVHADLFGDTELKFTGELSDDIDVLFLCVGHGDAKKFLDANPIAAHVKIIDLSQDFRLAKNSAYHLETVTADPEPTVCQFVYGLPELNRDSIRTAKNVANPGCFATCLQLGLLPLASKGLLTEDVHITATTGSTGAGQSLAPTSHFTWRNDNLSVYKVFDHQHLGEIGQSLAQLAAPFAPPSGGWGALNFVPYRGDFTRGIMANVYTPFTGTLAEANSLYKAYYAEHPFTHVSDSPVDVKQIVNTNKCFIQVKKLGNKIFMVSILDNLLKGASGQAVQNMNLMFGFAEDAGLRLKAAAF